MLNESRYSVTTKLYQVRIESECVWAVSSV